MDSIKKVKDIMYPIEEFHTIDSKEKLCEALRILKNNEELITLGKSEKPRRMIFVTGKNGKLIGQISKYDTIRGLVPQHVRHPSHSRAFYSVLSSRALEVADNVGAFQEHFKWHKSSFIDLVKQAGNANVTDIMSPIQPLLKDEDTINQAIYVMFKEKVRQPLVVRDEKVIGVVTFQAIFQELLEVIGPECNIQL